MRVRVLGPLEISAGGKSRRLRAAKQRALLAALVVRARGAVSVDRLVEELWDGQAPATAVNLVQGYVGDLRRGLDDRDGVLLRTQPPGYELVLPDGEVDLQRFEALTHQGRKALADGDSQGASDLLVEAQQLWRGKPFADVAPTAAVEAETSRLEELRLAALEARVDADLELRRHVDVLPELQTLVVAYPLRERFWVQLMLALYRSGRQAEALDAYQRLYRLFDGELGIQPANAARELQQQILNAAPGLESPLPRSAPAKAAHGNDTTVPRQLPAGIADFTGRTDLLERLDDLLPDSETSPAPAVVISAIIGTAGIGKTALAVHWAHRVAGLFPDGQLYVNLRGFDPIGQPVTPTHAVRGFLYALGVAPERIPPELDDQAVLYRSLLADRRMLVVLDNARDADQVRPLLPGAPRCLALITSRNRLESLIAAQAAHPVQVDLLRPDEAYDLLSTRLGKRRVAAEPEAVDALITSCARLPLALAIVAARAATHPDFALADLAAELDASRTSLDPFSGSDATTDLRAAFTWSYHQLDTDAQRLFRLLDLHPGPDITGPAAASLAGQPPTHVRGALSELCRAHLLTEHLPGRYTVHDLLRTYAAELAHRHDSAAERRTAMHRMLDHYLHTAYTADRQLNPDRDPLPLTPPRPGVTPELFDDDGRAMVWFATEHTTLLGCLRQAAGTGFDVHVWQLAWTMVTFFIRRGHRQDEADAARAALDATVRLGDRRAQAQAHRFLARANLSRCRTHDALTDLRHALALYAELGDRVGQAHTHFNLSQVWERQDRHADGLDQARQALSLYQAAGHRPGQARAHNAIGWYEAHLGHYQQALESCTRALALQQDLGNRDDEAATWDSLGYTHHRFGHHETAIDCYRQAAVMFGESGNRYEKAVTLTNLGQALHATGDRDAALVTWQDALAILDELDHPEADNVRAKLAGST